jgi:hypothetical protein
VTRGRLSAETCASPRSALLFLAERAAPARLAKALDERMHAALVTTSYLGDVQIRRAVGVLLRCVLCATLRRAQPEANHVATVPGSPQ